MSGLVHSISGPRAVSIVYPVAGGLASVLVAVHFGFGGRAVVGVVLICSLAALAATDIERRVLPNRIVVPSICLVLALQLALFPNQAIEWIAASVAVGLVLLPAALIKRGGLGYGDVKLGVLLGAGLGAEVLTCLAVAIFAMWPAAAYLCVRHGRAARTMALPFAPFVAVGAVVALLAS